MCVYVFVFSIILKDALQYQLVNFPSKWYQNTHLRKRQLQQSTGWTEGSFHQIKNLRCHLCYEIMDDNIVQIQYDHQSEKHIKNTLLPSTSNNRLNQRLQTVQMHKWKSC